jgi:hypothetical protein
MGASCKDLRRKDGGARGYRSRYLLLLFGFLVSATLLVSVPAALAYTTFKWSGEAAKASRGWANSGNWEGGLAPSSFEPVALEFPQLTSANCTASPPVDTCYESENNVSGMDVESMQVEDSQTYVIAGEPITLGSGGLNVAPATNTTEQIGSIMAMPVTLGARQTWSIAGQSNDEAIDGNQFVLLEEVSGAGQPLNISLSDGGGLVLVNEDEVGPLSFEGADSNRGGILNGVVELFGAQLNASDHESVSFNHVFAIGTGATGPLTTDAASIVVEPGEKKAERLEVQGATFDPKSRLTFAVTSTGTAAGREYAQLISSGLLNLEGAELVVAAEDSCKMLPAGTIYNFITSTGGIAGSFGDAGEGDEIPVTFPKGCTIKQTLQIHYERSGASETVTGTVVASNASTTRLEVSPAAPTTNEVVTLLATVSSSGSEPSFGTVQFASDGIPISACDREPVTAAASGYAATCRTSFAATRSPHQLSAVFTPELGINVRGSSATGDITVSRAPTTTFLQVASGAFVNESVTYTATISTPVSGPTLPSGTVQFTDGTTPIPSCSALPLQGGDLPTKVTCQVTYPSQGEHNVTVSYSGDTNFEGSVSAAQKLVVEPSLGAPSPLLGSSGEPELGEAKLEGTTVPVHAHVLAEVRVACHGSTSCKGKVSLWVREPIKAKHGKRDFRSVEIGSGVFSIADGKTAGIDIRLNTAGRAVLASHHGQVEAYLKLAQESETTQTSVRLVEAKPATKKKS